MTTAAISVRTASRTFGARKALDGVSLDVGQGEMVALIGPSGSGKSTLLRAVAGLTAIEAGGEISVFGADVQARGRITQRPGAQRARVGMVFQQFNLVARLSLFTNAALGALGRLPAWRGALGLWPDAEKRAVMEALQTVGVAEYAGQRAGTLSGGQQQRGAIARALVQRADILLADEPVASLDPVAARRVMELLKRLNGERGLTVVVCLHQVDHALRYCPRVVALSAGRLVYDGPGAGLDRARLIDIYGPEIEDAFWESGA